MPLTPAEFQLRKKLPPRRSFWLLFEAACLLGWTSVKEIAALAEVPYDRARVELRQLEREGWLTCEWRGAKTRGGRVRYRAKIVGGVGTPRPITGDRSDRSPMIGLEGVSNRGRARASDPDPVSGSFQDLTRPSVLGGAGGETDGRTVEISAEHRNATTKRVLRDWARWAVTPAVAYRGIDRLLKAGLSEKELEKFLRDALKGAHPAFVGVADHLRWGHSTNADRIAVWLRLERAAVHAPRETTSESEPDRATRAAQMRGLAKHLERHRAGRDVG